MEASARSSGSEGWGLGGVAAGEAEGVEGTMGRTVLSVVVVSGDGTVGVRLKGAGSGFGASEDEFGRGGIGAAGWEREDWGWKISGGVGRAAASRE